MIIKLRVMSTVDETSSVSRVCTTSEIGCCGYAVRRRRGIHEPWDCCPSIRPYLNRTRRHNVKSRLRKTRQGQRHIFTLLKPLVVASNPLAAYSDSSAANITKMRLVTNSGWVRVDAYGSLAQCGPEPKSLYQS